MFLGKRYVKLFLLSGLFIVTSCSQKDETSKSNPPTDAPSQPSPTTPPPQSEDNSAKIFLDGEGVSSKKNKFFAKLEWLGGPKADDYSKAKLVFSTSEKTKPNSVSTIVFDPQMPSMGHGTATDDQVISAEESSSNSFVVDGIYFIMGGRWEVRVTATVDGVTDLVAFVVDVP